jgi:peptidoglycan/xylan/chitin deacetylase (PgdA/CDA1 family)
MDHEGHIIGNHSYNHGVSFDWLTSAKMEQELKQTNDVIKKAIDKEPKLFRPPYGVTNPNLAKAVKRTGMYSIGWSVRSFDTNAKSKEILLGRLLNSIKGGDIILLHDTMPITKDILTELINKVRQKGFTFVRVDKLLEIDAYA